MHNFVIEDFVIFHKNGITYRLERCKRDKQYFSASVKLHDTYVYIPFKNFLENLFFTSGDISNA